MNVQCVTLNCEGECGFRGVYILDVLFSFAYPPGNNELYQVRPAHLYIDTSTDRGRPRKPRQTTANIQGFKFKINILVHSNRASSLAQSDRNSNGRKNKRLNRRKRISAF
jgi:hypothetical protein